MKTIDEDIKLACEILRKGGVILYPTDTVWGIGCDATQSNAVKKVFEVKRRADNKALIVMLGDEQQLERYVDDVPEIAYDLIDAAVKPLTIVYDRGCNLAPELLGEDGSVGIRITKENFSSRLCRAFRKPIVSTSANISGEPTPAIFKEISEDIKNSVDYIVETRRDDINPNSPSSVIKLGAGGTIKIIRN